MAGVKTQGIVIKQSDFGESNRIITIFTREFGIIKAVVYGAKSIKSKKGAACQFLTYADFVLSSKNSDLMTVQSVDVIESFYPLREDIEKLSLCVYFADLTYALLNQNSADEAVLSLFLNTVYALCYRDFSQKIIKAVFEMRITSLAGYMPNISECCVCASKENFLAFSESFGGIVCKNCVHKGDIIITPDVYKAISYIIKSETKRMFSFTISDEVLEKVCEICEKYVMAHTERSFSSLDYYKKIQL